MSLRESVSLLFQLLLPVSSISVLREIWARFPNSVLLAWAASGLTTPFLQIHYRKASQINLLVILLKH